MKKVYVVEIRMAKKGRADAWMASHAFYSRVRAEKWVLMSIDTDKRWHEKAIKYEYRIRTGKLDPPENK